jgi:hypothetical protein
MDDEMEVVVVVDDGCEHDILLVNMVAHNKIHHNTSVVDTIVVVVVVVEVYDGYIGHLVNFFALVDVFVFQYDDYRSYSNLNKILEKMYYRAAPMQQNCRSYSSKIERVSKLFKTEEKGGSIYVFPLLQYLHKRKCNCETTMTVCYYVMQCKNPNHADSFWKFF